MKSNEKKHHKKKIIKNLENLQNLSSFFCNSKLLTILTTKMFIQLDGQLKIFLKAIYIDGDI